MYRLVGYQCTSMMARQNNLLPSTKNWAEKNCRDAEHHQHLEISKIHRPLEYHDTSTMVRHFCLLFVVRGLWLWWWLLLLLLLLLLCRCCCFGRLFTNVFVHTRNSRQRLCINYCKQPTCTSHGCVGLCNLIFSQLVHQHERTQP